MARRRGQETIRDMALSLGVVMAGVLLVALFMPRGGGDPVRTVDTAAPVAAFARLAPFDVLAPTGLPDHWKPTSVRTSGLSDTAPGTVELTIGYVVDRPDDRTYAQLNESNARDAVKRVLGDRPVTGTVEFAGASWQERRDDAGHLALTRQVGDVVLIVSDGGGKGGASAADLGVLAASLRPHAAP
ncbi:MULTISPECIES: DUF4245 domain-containing protein [Protofrankia]|uniref:Secreted protein n=2 Tax=Protofrankia TaxID=2994361 RepID=F8AVX6_9ACTN|nr:MULTISPECIES: DUF4245 domain-containing protein [Protofrankia]AEH08319.1 hypothetical protein FsymDg_0805 [Candidatus Protofrankia datiscae]KLL13071.1 hypothetical protein FrCorBMG51_00660 [Protofrankia coriariae]ONH38052.1 hypothetical protein BL254_01025 [Protofrankia sp. BMG5.30]